MKLKFFSCLFLLLIISGCEKSDVLNTEEPLTRASGYTLFQNTKVSVFANGDCMTTGDIYCPAAADYTFIFTYDRIPDHVDIYYEAGVGPNAMWSSRDGVGNFREVTVRLQAGINRGVLSLMFSSYNQSGNARLVIRKINGRSLSGEPGSADLSVNGHSTMSPIGL